jgi:signal transduction histidine kinase
MEVSSTELRAQIEQAKLAALKELAYGASHEINNPLANISARAQLLLRDERDPERRRALEAIDQQALRAHEMIADLMLFARPPRLQCDTWSPSELVAQVAQQFADECQRRDVALIVETAAAPPCLRADRVQLGAALQAVVRNALEAIGVRGVITLTVSRRPGDVDGVRISVTDDGPGFAAEQLEHACDPFYSGREAGRGLGFGLSKCWRIVTEHGGRLEIASPVAGGALVHLDLPLDARSDGSAAADASIVDASRAE